LETYNDLNQHAVNFFQVLRDAPDELIRQIKLTPWARAEYEQSRQPHPDPMENARRFWVGCCMGISGSPHSNTGWRVIKNIDTAPNGLLSWFYVDLSHLEAAAQRLKAVQIENRPYDEVVAEYDHPAALIYFDPPYVSHSRSSKKEYAIEWHDDEHIAAAGVLHQAEGFVVVSGYATALYKELYEDRGWLRVNRQSATNSGGSRVESLWLSPKTAAALNRPRNQQFKLFSLT
jgi:DNA adenine methylase